MSIKDSWLSLLWKEDLSHKGPLTDLSNPTDRRDRLLGGRTLWNQAYGGNGQENFVLGALHPCIPSKAWRSPSRNFGLESSGKGSWASLSVACYLKENTHGYTDQYTCFGLEVDQLRLQILASSLLHVWTYAFHEHSQSSCSDSWGCIR